MRHDIIVEGVILQLRPIADADVALVVELRSNAELNRFLHPSSNCVEDQLAWLADYYQRAGDYYFVLERRDNRSPEGVISLYNIDSQMGRAEWGRWILKPGSLAAVESAWLIYRVAFEVLTLNSVYCRTVAANTKVVSFHDSCGIAVRRRLPQHFNIWGRRVDAIEHLVDRNGWVKLAPRLEKLAQMIGRRIAHG